MPYFFLLLEFREMRTKHDFFEMCRTPELACEVTLQVRKSGVFFLHFYHHSCSIYKTGLQPHFTTILPISAIKKIWPGRCYNFFWHPGCSASRRYDRRDGAWQGNYSQKYNLPLATSYIPIEFRSRFWTYHSVIYARNGRDHTSILYILPFRARPSRNL